MPSSNASRAARIVPPVASCARSDTRSPTGKTDLALDFRRHGAGDHLVDIGPVMRAAEPVCRRGRRAVQRTVGNHSPPFQRPHQRGIFAHRKAMRHRETGVVIGMADDRQGHGAVSPTATPSP
jgi:hypothetical protein